MLPGSAWGVAGKALARQLAQRGSLSMGLQLVQRGKGLVEAEGGSSGFLGLTTRLQEGILCPLPLQLPASHGAWSSTIFLPLNCLPIRLLCRCCCIGAVSPRKAWQGMQTHALAAVCGLGSLQPCHGAYSKRATLSITAGLATSGAASMLWRLPCLTCQSTALGSTERGEAELLKLD